jgi:ribosomal protein S6--L-glutamate ligase
VTKVHGEDGMRRLAPRWGAEPVVVQQFVGGNGWDTKLWVIDGELFAARRRSPLSSAVQDGDVPLSVRHLPRDAIEITRDIGDALDLQLYGVDLIMTRSGPIVADVNPFPGYRSAVGGVEALAAFVVKLAGREEAATGVR